MLCKGKSPAEVRKIVERVSYMCFDGNLSFGREPEAYRGAVRFTLRVSDSKGPGHRRKTRVWDGRKPGRLVVACYHAYGEVIRALLQNGATWIETGVMKLFQYRGSKVKPTRWSLRDFDTQVQYIAEINIGSQIYPVWFTEACDCETWGMPDQPQVYPASLDYKPREVKK